MRSPSYHLRPRRYSGGGQMERGREGEGRVTDASGGAAVQ